MQISPQEILKRLLIAIPLVVVGVLLAWKGSNHSQRFFMRDYRGDRRARFGDNLIGNCCYSLAAGFLMAICFLIFGEVVSWQTFLTYLPYGFGLAIMVLPFTIAGSYLRATQANPYGVGGGPKLLDISLLIRGVARPKNSSASQPIRIPPRAQRRGVLLALLVFAGVFGLTHSLDLSFGVRPGLLFQLELAAIYAAGTYFLMIVIRRAEKLRRMENGEPIDEDIN